MKATSIVRRVDDLGRIVIPKEIRRSVGIREGEALEIFIEEGRVIFEKYEEVDNASAYIEKALDSLKGKDQNVISMLQLIQGMVKDMEKES